MSLNAFSWFSMIRSASGGPLTSASARASVSVAASAAARKAEARNCMFLSPEMAVCMFVKCSTTSAASSQELLHAKWAVASALLSSDSAGSIAIGFTHLPVDLARIPPPLVGGGWGRGLAPVGANDACSSVGKAILLARCRAQTPPPCPRPQGAGEWMGLSLSCMHVIAVASGGTDVSSQGVHGSARAGAARGDPASEDRHVRHPGRGGAGGEPCADADRSRAGAVRHAQRPCLAGQSAVAAAGGGRAGAGNVPGAERLYLAGLVRDQAADRQGGADLELRRHPRL